MAMTTFTLRHALRPGDRPAIAALLEATGVFRPDEVAVALELVDDTLAPAHDRAIAGSWQTVRTLRREGAGSLAALPATGPSC